MRRTNTWVAATSIALFTRKAAAPGSRRSRHRPADECATRALRQAAPSHAACVFDGEGPSWRHELDPGYKEGHKPMPEALREALDGYREAFREIGVASLGFPGLEADDVIATIATKAATAGAAVTVLSTDKIFGELLASGIRVRDHFRDRDSDAARLMRAHGCEAVAVSMEGFRYRQEKPAMVIYEVTRHPDAEPSEDPWAA